MPTNYELVEVDLDAPHIKLILDRKIEMHEYPIGPPNYWHRDSVYTRHPRLDRITVRELVERSGGIKRIRCVERFYLSAASRYIEAGELGGFVTSERNLEQDTYCWLFDQSMVIGNATVKDRWTLHGQVIVAEDAQLWGTGRAYMFAFVYGWARLNGSSSFLTERALVCDLARAEGNFNIYGSLTGAGELYGNCTVKDTAQCRSIMENSAIIGDYIHDHRDRRLVGQTMGPCDTPKGKAEAASRAASIDFDIAERQHARYLGICSHAAGGKLHKNALDYEWLEDYYKRHPSR